MNLNALNVIEHRLLPEIELFQRSMAHEIIILAMITRYDITEAIFEKRRVFYV